MTKTPPKRRRRGTRPGLTREESRQLTRSRLLAAARAEFARGGLKGTNLTDILKRAEVSPGAFYHHFDDKLDLFLAVVDELSLITRRMLRESREHLRRPDEDVERWVTSLFAKGLEIARADKELFQIFVREMQSGNPRIVAFFEHDRALFRQEVADSLDELIERGFLSPFDTAWGAYMIGVMATNMMLEQLTNPADDEGWARAMAQITLGGLPRLQGLQARPPAPAETEPIDTTHIDPTGTGGTE